MDTATLKSYNWLRKIPGELFNLDEKPLLGYPPPFPFDAFSKELCAALHIENITITPGEIEWKSPEELVAGLGENLRSVRLALNPIPGNFWFALPEKGLKILANALSQKENKVFEDFIDPDFLNAYFEFFAMEAVRAFESANVDKKLSLSIADFNDLPKEACLGIDLNIQCKDDTIYCRLLLSQTFRKAWMQKYLSQNDKLNETAKDSLEVIIHLEAGKIDLKPSVWQKLSIGDVVLLDRCTLDPDGDKGRVMLVINGTPCFRAKIKQGSLKILEHPLYYEVDKSMPAPDKNKNPADHDDLFDEDEFTEDSTEHSDEHSEDLSDEHSEDLSDEHSEDLSEEHSDEFSDDDFDIEDDKTVNKPAALSPTKTAQTPEKNEPAIAAGTKSNTPLNIEEIPLNVVIEVGRIQMSVKKLLELQPGNMLELDIHPETNVDMVVNGKRIARGELLKIGEVLGLRITSLS